MSYSLISRTKHGDCSVCSNTNTNVVKVGKSLYCLSCHRKSKVKSYVAKAAEKSKIRSLHTPISNEERNEREELEKYFDNAAKIIALTGKCWECKAPIYSKFYRSATAHILPKAQFGSVKTHPLNMLVLGAGCGCHQLTDDLDKFCKMKVFPLAVERFKQFEHLITENHKYLTKFKEKVLEYEQGKVL